MNGIKQVISQRHLEWIAIRLPMIHRLRFQLFQNLFIGHHQMFAHIIMVGPLTLTLSMSTPSVILPSITLSGLRSVLLMPACGFQWGNKTTSTIVSIATASTTTTTTVKITTSKTTTATATTTVRTTTATTTTTTVRTTTATTKTATATETTKTRTATTGQIDLGQPYRHHRIVCPKELFAPTASHAFRHHSVAGRQNIYSRYLIHLYEREGFTKGHDSVLPSLLAFLLQQGNHPQ